MCVLSHPTFFFDSGMDLIVAVMARCKDNLFNVNQHFGPCSMVLMHLHASLLHLMIRYFGFDLLWLDALIFVFFLSLSHLELFHYHIYFGFLVTARCSG